MATPELRGKRVLVVGLGRSGIAAANLCLRKGAQVVGTDIRNAEQLGQSLSALDAGVIRDLAGHDPAHFAAAELIIVSPGVPPIAPLAAAQARGVPILGEIELAARFVTAPIVAVTGTNGKSTTTSLIGEMLVRSGRSTFVGGNLGVPLAEAVAEDRVDDLQAVVLELSSFQLETVERFSAHVALLLNVSEDHLDRYPDYASYLAAKARVFAGQTPADFAIVANDRDCLDLAAAGQGRTLPFGLTAETAPPAGAWLTASEFVLVGLSDADHATERYPISALRLAGRHNQLNALAAIAAARLFGASPAAVEQTLREFAGLPHRMAHVRTLDGVDYYNDSKATNVGSVVGGLAGFERPVVLIAGGKDKGGDYRPLAEAVSAHCRHVVLLGAAAELIAAALDDDTAVSRATTMDQAVAQARQAAQLGDAVVLAPACSSYDMYENYARRGDDFARAVNAL